MRRKECSTMENEGAAAANANANASPQTETLINAFCEITSSSSKSAALFFLESHNFNLDSAVSTFLEEEQTTTTPPPSAAAGTTSNLPESPSDSQKSYSPSNSESSSPSPPPPSKRQRNSSTAYNLRSSRVARVPESAAAGSRSDAIPRTPTTTTGSGSDSDDTQEYYSGSESQKSGMLVQDPSKGNDVDAIFDQARRHAAVEGPLERLPSPSSRSFTGTARRLTDEAESSVPQPPENVTQTITFWSNGFTVDDGPLRRFNDPGNASFLQSIRKSECPKELEPVDKKTSVRVNLIRREEKCPVPGKRRAPFQGKGRTLGSKSNAVPVESTVAILSLTAAPVPSVGLVVDQTQPSTSIQIRLADGTRMVSRFNYQHTIRDIRGFIDASRPGAPRSYQLQTVGFPPKQLADLDQTIEQASLANSVVIQKL